MTVAIRFQSLASFCLGGSLACLLSCLHGSVALGEMHCTESGDTPLCSIPQLSVRGGETRTHPEDSDQD